VHCLPRRAQKGLLGELCAAATRGDAYAALQRLGCRYGIADIRVSGDYGIVEGALADTVMLPAYARTRCWVPGINAAIASFFERCNGGTYIDIGANIGLTTIPIARRTGVACKAFEPEPQAFRYLKANLSRNCPGAKVETFNFALSDRRGTVAFELSDNNLGDHRIRLNAANGSFGEASRRVIEVPTDRLDDVLRAETVSHPVAIRLSTQGAECRVLEGGRTVLGAAAFFTFEFWPYGIARMGDNADRLIAFIAQRYSSAAVLDDKRDDSPNWKPIGEIATQLENFTSRSGDQPYAVCDVIARREPVGSRTLQRG
jgi:FkbM family methyltransferase